MMLTKTKPDGSWRVVGSDGKEIPWKDVPNELYGAICKLRDYEKTGLSPELVALIRDDNTRLCEENKRLCEANRRLMALVDELERVLKGSENNG